MTTPGTIYSKLYVTVINEFYLSIGSNRKDIHSFSFSLFAGIKLRKVEKIEQKEKERSTAFHDVASILARRVAIELSESEDSDSDEDSECWVEPNETTT